MRCESIFRSNCGYTLLELMVVISLLVLLLFFAVPRFHNAVLADDGDTAARVIINTIDNLKAKAVKSKTDYILHIGLDTNRLWSTHAGMTEEARLEAAEGGVSLPDDVDLMDVEFPLKGKVSVGRADIRFYRQGYTDKALIHLREDDDQPVTFRIESFLPNVTLIDRYVEFE